MTTPATPATAPVGPFAGPDAQHFGTSILKAVERLFFLLLFMTVGGFLVVAGALDELDHHVGAIFIGLVFWGAGGIICLAPLIRDRGLRLSVSDHGVRLRRSGESSVVRWAEIRRLQWTTLNGNPHRLVLEKWDGTSLEIPMEAVAKSRDADAAIRRVFGA